MASVSPFESGPPRIFKHDRPATGFARTAPSWAAWSGVGIEPSGPKNLFAERSAMKASVRLSNEPNRVQCLLQDGKSGYSSLAMPTLYESRVERSPSLPSLTSSSSPSPRSSLSTMGAITMAPTMAPTMAHTMATPGILADASFYPHLVKLERWSKLIGANLLAHKFALGHKGRWRPIAHSALLIVSLRAFLLLSLLRELFVLVAVDPEQSLTMLYVGDFSNIYGVHVDRLAYNAFRLCWGLHATALYFWLTRADGTVRKWLALFEDRWLATAKCVKQSLQADSLARMRTGAKFATFFVWVTSTIATGMVTALNLYGYHSGLDSSLSRAEASIYLAWCAVHMLWFWVTFVINMTAFGHHFLLCRAIHVRFDETKRDFEFIILSPAYVRTSPQQISSLISKHFFVCDMVKQANKHLKIFLFIFYMIFAPHLCFMIYQIIYSTHSTAQGRIFIAFLLILSDFFQVYSVSVLSAQITSKSAKPYYEMHGLNKFSSLSQDVKMQTTLFMQRISCTIVGLTILDSFVLTAGLISSMITAVVTYFSVIVQSS